MSRFALSIVTPAGTFFSGEVEMLAGRSQQGEFGMLAQHEPMLAALPCGPLRIKTDQGEKCFAIEDAVLVMNGHEAWVLADAAENAKDLAEARQKAKALHQKMNT